MHTYAALKTVKIQVHDRRTQIPVASLHMILIRMIISNVAKTSIVVQEVETGAPLDAETFILFI